MIINFWKLLVSCQLAWDNSLQLIIFQERFKKNTIHSSSWSKDPVDIFVSFFLFTFHKIAENNMLLCNLSYNTNWVIFFICFKKELKHIQNWTIVIFHPTKPSKDHMNSEYWIVHSGRMFYYYFDCIKFETFSKFGWLDDNKLTLSWFLSFSSF